MFHARMSALIVLELPGLIELSQINSFGELAARHLQLRALILFPDLF